MNDQKVLIQIRQKREEQVMATPRTKTKAGNSDAVETISSTTTPLIFISHDTRDAEIAEAFSRLLSSVSAGVLKSFRSSDQKGTQGIEYGTEWYGEIMKKLDSASDVVCLLTPRSLERPWLLYEAGVAKGKLDKTVLGVALGIPLGKAVTGPFAQFQNCDDSDEKLTSLVMQLVQRIPNAEPDRGVIKTQVSSFKQVANEILEKLGNTEQEGDAEETSVAELFEEVKIMFQDLPSRIDRQVDPRRRRKFRKFHPLMFEEIGFFHDRSPKNPVALLIAFSFFKEDMPWLYDVGTEIYRAVKTGKTREAEQLFRDFKYLLEYTIHTPFLNGVMDKDLDMLLHEIPYFIEKTFSYYLKPRLGKVIGSKEDEDENEDT